MKKLSDQEIDKVIASVEATLAIEWLSVSEDAKEWTKQFLQGKLTSEEVIGMIKNKYTNNI